jgi:hypothetical protein
MLHRSKGFHMLRTILLFPFRLLAGALRLAICIPWAIYRVGDGAVRVALPMAMVVALVHVGIGTLIGRTNVPLQILEGAVIGALVGLAYGAYQALNRPKALPTPAVFRPRFSQRLSGAGWGLCRGVALRVALLGFFGLVITSAALEWVTLTSPAEDPNPPTAARTDLSVIETGHPALTLVSAEPPAGAGFRLEARPMLLASLAKLYADPRFDQLVTARAVFQNTGAERVTGYRVRFRLTDFSPEWSPWSGAAQVLPQETVTTPYYPLLDEARLARLDSFALVDLQVEQEYRRADGALVHHTQTRRVKVMARNYMAFGHFVPEDQEEAMVNDPASPFWRDAYATMPLLLPAFVTKDDPVIQQVAGWVSGQAGGAPSSSDDDAQVFLRALYEFMVANGIRYQTPSGGDRDGWEVQFAQHGRDVLQNRAGCCLDLTIFYASVCEAVGLEPVLVLVPHHIFPAVRLPKSKELVPVEVTMVGSSRPQDGWDYLVSGFGAAVKIARTELDEARQGAHLEVDIAAQRKAGVQGLQLPPVAENALAAWGIHPVAATPPWQVLAYWAALIGGLVLARRLWQQGRLARQLRSADPQVRFQAVAALGQLRSAWSARMLIRTLADGDEHVREAAEAALEARGERVTVQSGRTPRLTGLPSLGASRRALLALAAGQFDSVVISEPAPIARRPAPQEDPGKP